MNVPWRSFSSDDIFSHIASEAPLRPYMDAHGNIKWIGRRSSDSKQHGTQMQDAAKLEHLRGGGDWPAQDAHAASRGGALASYGSPVPWPPMVCARAFAWVLAQAHAPASCLGAPVPALYLYCMCNAEGW